MDANFYDSVNWIDYDAAIDPNSVPYEFTASSSTQNEGFPPWGFPIEETAEEKSASVSRSHSQAEKRRRDRINAQLTALRKMIPKSDKVNRINQNSENPQLGIRKPKIEIEIKIS